MKQLILLMLVLTGMLSTGNIAAQDDISQLATQQVNINTAGVEALARVLTGVGLSKAQEIVNHREAFGKFSNVNDLAQVKGIGERIMMANEGRILTGQQP